MSDSLRIAFFVGCFPVLSETFIVRQIASLIRAGHSVDIFADCRSSDTEVQPEVLEHRLQDRTTWMDMPPEMAPYEMPIWPLTGRTWPPGSVRSVSNVSRLLRALPSCGACFLRHPRLAAQVLLPKAYGYRARSLSGLHRLRKLSLKKQRYDVLHAHFGPVANSFRFARELWRRPLLVSFHGFDFCTVPRKEGRDVYESLFKTADIFTANSQFTRARLLELGCPPERIRGLSVGLDLDDFPFTERHVADGEPVKVIAVGRLVEIKGHEFAIRAVAELRQRGRIINLDLVGDGPLRSQLEQLASELGVLGQVIFHGALGTHEVRRLMDRARIFVMPSVTVEGDQEGQGLVVQEAQATGLPVIVTRHGALPEGMLPGHSGFVVPERDVPALAERIEALACDPELCREMGRHGRRFVEDRYDIRKLTESLISFYREAVESFKL